MPSPTNQFPIFVAAPYFYVTKLGIPPSETGTYSSGCRFSFHAPEGDPLYLQVCKILINMAAALFSSSSRILGPWLPVRTIRRTPAAELALLETLRHYR
jgi:hypothetical protein